jgi:DNA-binding NarL/FixJ family response regulator
VDSNPADTRTTSAAEPRIAAHRAPAETVLALIDQSRLRRECLKLAMAQHNARWRVVDMASAAEVVRLADAGQRFDLVLVGAATSEHIDLDEIETLRASLPDTPIVVSAESENPHRARLILKAGTRGFLPASLSLKVMMGALDLVMAGGVYVPSSLIEPSQTRAAEPVRPTMREPWSELTRRQRDVLGLISQGKSNKLIADALDMSESTVKAHVKQIIKRLRVANRTQAALLAAAAGPLHVAVPAAVSARPAAAVAAAR